MIYINGRFLTQPLTGVNRYAYEMVTALRKNGVDFKIICPKQNLNEVYNVCNFEIVKFGFGHSHCWEQLSLPFFFFGKKNFILVSFTGLGPIIIKSKISTIHDLAFLENPSWYSFSYRFFYRFVTPFVINSCRHILTVSNFSKSEIVRYYNIKLSDVSVIYNACCESWNSAFFDKNLDKPYFLCVASIEPRKNFPQLIEVFRDLKDLNLLIVGSYSKVFSRNNLGTIPSNVFFLGRVDDAKLAQLYKNAKAFIYPSLYEGFGLPPIEAMHFGCPVLLSDIPVFREVCNDAAIYFNPKDKISITNAIKFFNQLDDAERIKIINAGFENIKRFSWGQSALQLIKILNSYSV